jgi:hypothetical protein
MEHLLNLSLEIGFEISCEDGLAPQETALAWRGLGLEGTSRTSGLPARAITTSSPARAWWRRSGIGGAGRGSAAPHPMLAKIGMGAQ